MLSRKITSLSWSVTDLPTALTMLPQAGGLCLLVWCKACHHQAPADLQALVDVGRGDVPIKDLRFRCAQCGSRLTDSVVMARERLGWLPATGLCVAETRVPCAG